MAAPGASPPSWGMDYAIDKKWSFNLDAKYIQMDTDVKLGGTKIGKLDLNPITYGVGHRLPLLSASRCQREGARWAPFSWGFAQANLTEK